MKSASTTLNSKKADKRVLVFGTFDRLHPGHLFVFAEAAKRGAVHIVVARDRSVGHIKGRAPMQTEEQRLQAVQAAVPEAQVRLGDTEDYLLPVREIAPDLILLGYDQRLPPGVEESSFPCPVERLPAFHPEKYKSSLMKGFVVP